MNVEDEEEASYETVETVHNFLKIKTQRDEKQMVPSRTSLPKLLLLFGCPVIICINFLLLTLSTPDQLDQLYLPDDVERRATDVVGASRNGEGTTSSNTTKDVPGAFISLDDSSKCLDTMSHTRASQKAGLFQCHYQGGTQSWTWSSEYERASKRAVKIVSLRELDTL